MNKRLTNWLIAVALLPLLWGILHQTGRMFPALLDEGFSSWWRYAAGAALYLLIERVLARPMWLYVFGHELTHAVSGILSGASIKSFKAKSTGGEVRLSKSNAFIALSPYIIPLYSILVIVLYAVTRRWWDPPALKPVFEFVLGLTLAFHVSHTISALHKRQSDLKVLGFFLSGVLILMGNVFILAVLCIALFSKTPTFTEYRKGMFKDTKTAWNKSIQFSVEGGKKVYSVAKEQPWTR